jgi:NADH dehydrogenase
MGDRVVPGMGNELREFVENALNKTGVEVFTSTKVMRLTRNSVTIEHNGVAEEIETAGVVWTAGVRVSPLIESLELQKNERGLIIVDATLQAHGRTEVFALGDIAYFTDANPRIVGTAQLAYQQSRLAADNIKAYLHGRDLKTKYFEELGEAVSLGTENAALLVGNKPFGGPLARQARFALYTGRLPTWHHRLKVGSSWFFGGTAPRPLQPLGL